MSTEQGALAVIGRAVPAGEEVRGRHPVAVSLIACAFARVGEHGHRGKLYYVRRVVPEIVFYALAQRHHLEEPTC